MTSRRKQDWSVDRYAALHQGFGWKVPEKFNMAQVCCGRWAQQPQTASHIAIREHVPGEGLGRSWSFAQLQDAANRLSRVLDAQGVRRGDRVAIVLPQRFETAVAYMAVLQMGAVAMPLSMLFGPEALAFRIQDSAAAVLIADEAAMGAVQQARAECPGLRCVIGVGAAAAQAALDAARLALEHVELAPPDPWATATRGEALLLLNQFEDAITAYRAASRAATSVRARNSMYVQAAAVTVRIYGATARDRIDEAFGIVPPQQQAQTKGNP